MDTAIATLELLELIDALGTIALLILGIVLLATGQVWPRSTVERVLRETEARTKLLAAEIARELKSILRNPDN